MQGILPSSMISVILVPIIKDKTGKINGKDNYRPIEMTSAMSNVFEKNLMSACITITLSALTTSLTVRTH